MDDVITVQPTRNSTNETSDVTSATATTTSAPASNVAIPLPPPSSVSIVIPMEEPNETTALNSGSEKASYTNLTGTAASPTASPST